MRTKGAPEYEIEGRFQLALDFAREQSTWTFELQAVMSMTQLNAALSPTFTESVFSP